MSEKNERKYEVIESYYKDDKTESEFDKLFREVDAIYGKDADLYSFPQTGIDNWRGEEEQKIAVDSEELDDIREKIAGIPNNTQATKNENEELSVDDLIEIMNTSRDSRTKYDDIERPNTFNENIIDKIMGNDQEEEETVDELRQDKKTRVNENEDKKNNKDKKDEDDDDEDNNKKDKKNGKNDKNKNGNGKDEDEESDKSPVSKVEESEDLESSSMKKLWEEIELFEKELEESEGEDDDNDDDSEEKEDDNKNGNDKDKENGNDDKKTKKESFGLDLEEVGDYEDVEEEPTVADELSDVEDEDLMDYDDVEDEFSDIEDEIGY